MNAFWVCSSKVAGAFINEDLVVLLTGMWCIASLFWHDRFQHQQPLSLSLSFTRRFKHHIGELFHCLRTVAAVAICIYYSTLLSLILIVFFGFLSMLLLQLISDSVPRWHAYLNKVHYYSQHIWIICCLVFFCSGIVRFVTLRLQFDCFYALCIICIFHFLFHVFKKFEHAPPPIEHAPIRNEINREILTSKAFNVFFLLQFKCHTFTISFLSFQFFRCNNSGRSLELGLALFMQYHLCVFFYSNSKSDI